MQEIATNPARLYLPLLVDAQPKIRQHASVIMLGTYGERAFTYLRQLFDDPDEQVRAQARQALHTLRDITGCEAELRPIRGIYIECLGHLRVYIGSREIRPRDWKQLEGGRAGWHKVQGVFAYLVHCGRRGTSREELGAMVWGGAVSASSLSRTLSALRQVLSDAEDPAFVDRAMIITRDHCILSPDVYHTDVQLFDRTFNIASYVEQAQGLAAAAPLYSQTSRLYGGSYMADVPCGEIWSQERHDMLMNAFVIAVERLAEYAYTMRRYQQCIGLCRQALRADPCADDVTAWLLRACTRMSMYTEVEQVYRSYLRAASVALQGSDAQQHLVGQKYMSLGRARAVGA
jgi:DNA-binding SARP family transcriptional activator